MTRSPHRLRLDSLFETIEFSNCRRPVGICKELQSPCRCEHAVTHRTSLADAGGKAEQADRRQCLANSRTTDAVSSRLPSSTTMISYDRLCEDKYSRDGAQIGKDAGSFVVCGDDDR